MALVLAIGARFLAVTPCTFGVSKSKQTPFRDQSRLPLSHRNTGDDIADFHLDLVDLDRDFLQFHVSLLDCELLTHIPS